MSKDKETEPKAVSLMKSAIFLVIAAVIYYQVFTNAKAIMNMFNL